MKTINLIDHKCPSCGGANTAFSLQERDMPYGVAGPKQVTLRFHAIVQSCSDCGEQFLGWPNEAIADTAVEVYYQQALEEGLEESTT